VITNQRLRDFLIGLAAGLIVFGMVLLNVWWAS
jgi:hypothetical protein